GRDSCRTANSSCPEVYHSDQWVLTALPDLIRGLKRALFVLESVDFREVSIQAVDVEPIADHEVVGNGEAHVIQRDVDLAAFDLVEQGADLEAPGVPRLEVPAKVVRGPPRVDHVLDEDDVASLDGAGEIGGEA